MAQPTVLRVEHLELIWQKQVRRVFTTKPRSPLGLKRRLASAFETRNVNQTAALVGGVKVTDRIPSAPQDQQTSQGSTRRLSILGSNFASLI